MEVEEEKTYVLVHLLRLCCCLFLLMELENKVSNFNCLKNYLICCFNTFLLICKENVYRITLQHIRKLTKCTFFKIQPNANSLKTALLITKVKVDFKG